MKIQVTQKHIDQGVKEECESCPIALAINDCINVAYIGVTSTYVRIQKNESNESKKYNIPIKVFKFVIDFDQGKEVKPFSFNLKI